MLQQTFLPASKLGITFEQRDALVRLFHRLEQGLIPPEKLDMGRFHGCAKCLAGHSGPAFFWFNDSPLPSTLRELFALRGQGETTPERDLRREVQKKATLLHATKALHNYLTTGEPRWREVLHEETPS